MTQTLRVSIFFYITLLLLIAPINLLSFDTYYYWEWSRHLDLSYYDGSPMIAYFIKSATLLFGDTLLALSLVGIVSLGITAYIIFQTARLFLSKEASYIAMALWLFSPMVTLTILREVTYDTPLTLFWALSIYFTVKYITFNQTKDLYWLALSLGLMLLSKYSGIVLILALLLFLVSTPYRSLLKNKHFYLCLLVILALFTPVLIWNEQHHWVSFLYQLSTHQTTVIENPVFKLFKSVINNFLPGLNLLLIPPLICYLKKPPFIEKHQAMIVRLCTIICSTTLIFYLVTTTEANLRTYWLSPYLISAALLGGYCFQIYGYRQLLITVIAIYSIVSLCIMLNGTYLFSLSPPTKRAYYHLIQRLNASFTALPKTILTADWFEARMLFFLKNKPLVYSVDCGGNQNQYALWSNKVVRQIKEKSLKEALYIDIHNRKSCIEPYFDQCTDVSPDPYTTEHKTYTIYAYLCTNHSPVTDHDRS